MLPHFTRQKKGRWKVGMIRRIRIHLSLEAERGMLIVDRATFAGYAVQVVACIELHSRQSCRYGHSSARPGLPYLSKRLERQIFFIDNEAEIETAICISDFLANRFHRPEIQWRALNRSNFACRDQFAVYRKIHA